MKYIYLRAAMGGKTAKNKVLPRFCKKNAAASHDVAATVVVLPAKNLPWRPCTYLNYMRLYDFSLQGVKCICSSGF